MQPADTQETIFVAPDQEVVLVHTLQDSKGGGALEPWALATSVEIIEGQLTVLAGGDMLAVYAPGEWQFVGQVWFAVGQHEVQRDGVAVICA